MKLLSRFTETDTTECQKHHYPEKWSATDEYDLISPRDIKNHTGECFDDYPFHVKIYRRYEKKCMHEDCYSTKKKYKKVFSIHESKFAELMNLFDD